LEGKLLKKQFCVVLTCRARIVLLFISIKAFLLRIRSGGRGHLQKGSYYRKFGVVSYVIGEGGGGGYGDILSQKMFVFFIPRIKIF
jgi:hypothetical protein